MGQRSQIYVRVKDSNHTYLIARYYWCNYGERMVSRARYAVQWLREKFEEAKSEMPESYLLPMMVRILDTNFDKFDCQISTCLIKEWAADFMDEDFREYVFCHGNNDNGRLFLDVDITQKSVKYAFLDDKANLEQLMDAEAYMAWDNGEHEDWRLPLDDEECQYTEQNIAYIADNATLMSREELEAFMAFDYAYLSVMLKESGE